MTEHGFYSILRTKTERRCLSVTLKQRTTFPGAFAQAAKPQETAAAGEEPEAIEGAVLSIGTVFAKTCSCFSEC